MGYFYFLTAQAPADTRITGNLPLLYSIRAGSAFIRCKAILSDQYHQRSSAVRFLIFLSITLI
jgi:hypothetical protein